MVKKAEIEEVTIDDIKSLDEDCSVYVSYKKGIIIFTIIGQDEAIGVLNDILYAFRDGEITHKINVEDIDFMFAFRECPYE